MKSLFLVFSALSAASTSYWKLHPARAPSPTLNAWFVNAQFCLAYVALVVVVTIFLIEIRDKAERY